ELGRTGEAKSALPIIIIGQIALACLGDVPATANAEIDRLAAELGGVFWRIDDLADLASDARSGAINAVLLRAGIVGERAGQSPLRHAIGDLLAGSLIEDTVDDLLARLDAADRLLASCARVAAAARFREMIRCYLRSWIT